MQDSGLNTRSFEYADGDWSAEGYVSMAKNLGAPAPCVLIAPDWSGVNENTQATADRLAELGYVAIALDVYGKGQRGDPKGDNSHLMTPLLEDRGLLRERLLAGLAAAQELEEVDQARVAIIGYCFGGLCALDLARNSPDGLRGAISFHGLLSPPPYEVAGPVQPRLLLLHGWDDPMVPPADVVTGLKEFTDAGATWEFHAYGHAMHAFTFKGANFPERGIVHNPLADRRSWSAASLFLQECLGEGDAIA